MPKQSTKIKTLHSPAQQTNPIARAQHEVHEPYSVRIQIEGVAMILFHRYDPEQIEAQAKAKKGSLEKRTDNIEASLYRDEEGTLCIPNFAIKSCICNAARSVQDPRSKRKSAQDLFRAAILIGPEMASLGTKDYDGIDKRGVRVQMARVTRCRPFLNKGWKCEFTVDVLEPSFITEDLLRDIIDRAGKFHGLMDFRPDYGRFMVTEWKRQDFLSVQ
jgi:hypothetical protein